VRILISILYVAAFGAIAYLGWQGRDYYATALTERPHHDLHWELKPGGSRGHALGIAGGSMMALMLLYSVRKRVPGLRRAGHLSTWLRGHIFLGIVGPALVILHTAFKVQGLVAISFWSMIAVAASGFAGRFLYLQLPRTAAGDELTLAEATELNRELSEELSARFGLTPAQMSELDAIAGSGHAERQSPLSLLLTLPIAPLLLRWRIARFRRRCLQVPRQLLTRLASLARQKVFLQRRLLLWSQLRELFHYWHVIHKPFAVLMYLFAVVHVAVAWITGYAGGGP
jgi:hypothetical protein